MTTATSSHAGDSSPGRADLPRTAAMLSSILAGVNAEQGSGFTADMVAGRPGMSNARALLSAGARGAWTRAGRQRRSG